MDSGSLSTALDAVASTGFVLSVEQRSALQSSLLLLRQAEKFTRVVLFGRITAVSRDYLVAQGFAAADPLVPAKSFYSTDGVTWAQLPEVHPMLAATCNRINNRFTGNPSHEYTVTEPAPPPGTDIPADLAELRKETTREDGAKEIISTVSEDKRLASVVATMTNEVAVVPFGAFRKTAAGTIEANGAFGGVASEFAGNLDSYAHQRHGDEASTNLTDKAQMDKSIHFLKSIADDVPTNGSWALLQVRGGEVVLGRSLLWPGFAFYHVPATPQYGFVYVGTGTRNVDLAFMLP
eukprot:m.242208 g.242208  ORF g.242208 m.242208 type:complete len:293 (+) comp19006_c6_seq1:298-1176(+)